MSESSSRTYVFIALGFGLLAFGFAPIFVRYGEETPAILLAAYRTVFAAFLMFPCWLYHRMETGGETTGNPYQLLLSGACLGLHFTLWISSIYYTSVASASVLVTVHPVMLILVERLLFKEQFATTTWIGVFTAFSGSVLLGLSDRQATGDFTDPVLGNALALAAAAMFAVYLLIGQNARQKNSWIEYVFPVYLFAAVTCVLFTIGVQVPFHATNLVGLGAAFGMAVGPQILGHGSMNYAVKYISPTVLSTLILTEPVIASVAAYLLFSELPPWTSFLSMAVILAGIALVGYVKQDD